MIAYHGDPSVKEKYLARVTKHEQADQLIQGYGYWQDGKGCAVGCTLHGDCHADYETELGVPERIAYLEDAIFEGLPVELARMWPRRLLESISVGADLSLVWNRFALWLLTDSGLLMIDDVNRAAIEGVAELHRRVIAGETVGDADWSAAAAARSARWSATWSAAAAAAAATTWSAAAARSARSAAAAAWSARSAESAYTTMSEKLLELLASTPNGNPLSN